MNGTSDLSSLIELLDTEWGRALGFPGARDFDYSNLMPIATRYLLNNVGDPRVGGVSPGHTKPTEVEVVDWFAKLFGAPEDDYFGYVTTGGTEGNLYALWQARNLYPDGVVYCSAAAHPSVLKSADIVGLPAVEIPVGQWGETLYDDLLNQVVLRRDQPAIIVATAGTTMTEAVDDVKRIKEVLDRLAVNRRFIHVDAALSGVPLALMPRTSRPGFDFHDGADSITVSGHKFIGSPFPCGVVLIRKSLLAPDRRRSANYVSSPDLTLTGSRSGYAPLILSEAIGRFGIDGMRERADTARSLAAYLTDALTRVGVQAFRHPHALTVVFPAPHPSIAKYWHLPVVGGWSHAITMPGVTREMLDAFIKDIENGSPS